MPDRVIENPIINPSSRRRATRQRAASSPHLVQRLRPLRPGRIMPSTLANLGRQVNGDGELGVVVAREGARRPLADGSLTEPRRIPCDS
jgi:hypothetical protein